LVEIYVKATGKETIEKALDRDRWFSAKEALDFGLLDGIISSYKDLKM
jgi:ATP-dependent Clp protease protease subunit